MSEHAGVCCADVCELTSVWMHEHAMCISTNIAQYGAMLLRDIAVGLRHAHRPYLPGRESCSTIASTVLGQAVFWASDGPEAGYAGCEWDRPGVPKSLRKSGCLPEKVWVLQQRFTLMRDSRNSQNRNAGIRKALQHISWEVI